MLFIPVSGAMDAQVPPNSENLLAILEAAIVAALERLWAQLDVTNGKMDDTKGMLDGLVARLDGMVAKTAATEVKMGAIESQVDSVRGRGQDDLGG